MKKTTRFNASLGIAALAVLAFSSVKAQITLTQSDMPRIGDAYQVATDNTPTVTPGSAGANVTWNLSALNNQGVDTSFYVAPYVTPYASQFPSSNLTEIIVDGGNSIYGYLNTSASALTTQSVVFPGFVIGFVSPAETVVALPATYLSHWSTAYTNTDYYPGEEVGYDSTKEVQHEVEVDTVDGWGKVITPAATYANVLRTKVITTVLTDSTYFRDSITHVWKFQTVTSPAAPTENFYWYANGKGSPAASLSLNTVGGATTSGNYLYATITGIGKVSNNLTTEVYPNPASSSINFVLNSGNANGYIKIIDLAGREIEATTFSNGRAKLNTSSYASGMYLYLMTDTSGNLLDNGKFTVTH